MNTLTYHFNVKVNYEKDRTGLMSSPVLNSTIKVATPSAFPNGMEATWSPEHLLVAAVNSCLMTTFLAIAEKSKFPFAKFESNADGKLEMVEGKYMISEIVLSPDLLIYKEADREKALRLLQKSADTCLVSNSIKSKIIFIPDINVA